MTQYGRALHELNIDILCANAPQGKGRVERVHKTLQDRLVKELRLAGVSDLDAANAFVPGFIEDFNGASSGGRHGSTRTCTADLAAPGITSMTASPGSSTARSLTR